MTSFGVTPQGFVPKGFDTILAESTDSARAVFGDDLDLSPTSPVRKILEVAAAEDARLWRRLEDLYWSRFLSSAVGADLDALGEDIGVERAFLAATGEVAITVQNPQAGRTYTVREGTVLITTPGGPVFHTTAAARLTAAADTVTVGARAFLSGPDGDIAANTITAVDPDFLTHYLPLPPPTRLTVDNPAPFSGGSDREPDERYRQRLLGRSRTLWTPAAVREAALDVPGVVDVLLADPLGGVDVSQSYFNAFPFDQRLFSPERLVGEPYFFSIVVAHEFARPWRTEGPVTGIFEQVTAAVDRVRPVGIHPQVVEADHIEVGLTAQLLTRPGYDAQALLGALTERLITDISALTLGADVLFSQVMRAIVEQPGIADVQGLRLRRCPPAFGRVTLGQVAFAADVVEAGPGENLAMGPTEIAVFGADSALLDVEVTAR
jgi:phage-related baseplate assembly protein